MYGLLRNLKFDGQISHSISFQVNHTRLPFSVYETRCSTCGWPVSPGELGSSLAMSPYWPQRRTGMPGIPFGQSLGHVCIFYLRSVFMLALIMIGIWV